MCTHAHAHKMCNTYCFATATVVSRTRLSVTLYVHCLCSIPVSLAWRCDHVTLYNHKFPVHVTPIYFCCALGCFFGLVFQSSFYIFESFSAYFSTKLLFSFCTDALNPTAVSHIFQRLRDLLVIFVLWSSHI